VLLVTFVLYLAVIVGIGVWLYGSNRDLDDFVLGGRRIGPWVTALSAEASDMSAWLLLGLPGAAWATGLSVVWTAIGLAAGTLFNWVVVARRLRVESERLGAITIPGFLEARFGNRGHALRRAGSAFIVIFYAVYISAQFMAAGKLMEVTFGIPYRYGILIGALVMLGYTATGGFLAVCWTDLFQGMLMGLGVVVLPVAGILYLGGWAPVAEAMAKAGPEMLAWSGGNAGGALLGFLVGSLAWGLGYPGQPHILVRFMAIRDPRKLRLCTAISMVWVILALAGAILIGLVARAVLDPATVGDKEQVMPLLAAARLPAAVAGILLSAAVAAMMSTVDSQVLVVSAAVTRDLFRRAEGHGKDELLIGRLVTGYVGLAALKIALSETEIFARVKFTWAGLASSFGPVLLLSLFWRGMRRAGAIAGMVAGGATVLVWGNIPATNAALNPIVPGCAAALVVAVGVSLAAGGKE
jgi:sodium/proline symporter